MSLQPITHIEGLEGFDSLDMPDDTNPGATRIKFWVQSEEMPFLSEKEGKIVRQNFVWIQKMMNLGNLIVERRIRDVVEFDETARKWKVKKLAQVNSDIKQYAAEWNAFAIGASQDAIGTPLSMLFKNDPSKVEQYKFYHVHSIEQLASLTHSHVESIGIGTMSDVERAKAYIARLNEQAPKVAIHNELEAKDRALEQQAARIAELESKLTQILEAQLSDGDSAPKVKRGRKPKEDLAAEE